MKRIHAVEAAQAANPDVSWEPVFDGLQLVVTGVPNLLLYRVRLQGNQSWPLIWIDSSREVLLDSCPLEGNTGSELFWIGPEAEGVSLHGCRIEGNQVQALFPPDSLEPVLVQTSIVGNAFEVEEGDYTWPEYEQ